MAKVRLMNVVSAFCMLMAVVSTAAAESSGAPGWLEPSDEVVSEHIAWAKPAADGPIRVLFITYRHGMREIVELSQRFDLQREVFCTHMQDSFGYDSNLRLRDTSTQARERSLRAKLNKDYDVIVVGNIKWDVLPQWARDAVLEKVKAGAGLVAHLYGDMNDQIKSVFAALPQQVVKPQPALPYAGLPAFRDASSYGGFLGETMQPVMYGQGRAVLLKGFFCPPRQMLTAGLIDPAPRVYRVHYDYYLALAGHALRWAAQRTPAVRVVQPQSPNVIDTHVDRFKRLDFTLISREPGKVRLRCALRHSDYGTVLFAAEKSIDLQTGENAASFDGLPHVPAGNYFADLWVYDGDKVIDFGSVLYRAASTSHVTDVQLNTTVLSPNELLKSFRTAEPITGKVVIAQPQTDQSITVAQRDNHGRLVASVSQPVKAQGETCEITFELRPPPPLSIGQHLEVKLIHGGRVLDFKRVRFFYADLRPPKDEVMNLVATISEHRGSRPTSYLYPVALKTLENAGFDTAWVTALEYTRGYFSLACIDSNLRPMVTMRGRPRKSASRFVDLNQFKITTNALGEVRDPCLTDPAFLQLADELYADGAKHYGPLSVEAYNLGDECMHVKHNKSTDICFSDTCVADYRQHLQAKYSSLDKLNEAYGSSFEGWSQVEPINLEQARKTGGIARWIDHRRHMDSVWARYFDRARSAVHKYVPDARTGYEGSNDPGHLPQKIIGLGGTDYWKLARSMDLNGMYYFQLQLDAVRSFSDPGYLAGGGWFGSYPQMFRAGKDPLHHKWWVWRSILHGANSTWVFASDTFRSAVWSMHRADGGICDYFKPTTATMRTISRGPGKLLLNARRDDDRIAVLYSPSSLLLATFTTDLAKEWDPLQTMPLVFDEAGFQYRLISSTQLEGGILKRDGFEVLYLSYCQALSPREVETIRDFAAGGGAVIADLRPAVADDHGKAYPQGALDELFGVKQNTAAPQPKVTKVTLKEKVGSLEGELPETHVDTTLAVTTGKALAAAGDTPAVIVNRYDKGMGVLLNLTFADYFAQMYRDGSFARFGSPEKAEQSKALLQGVLAMANRKPAIAVEPYVTGAHVYRYTLDGAHIAGLLWHAPAWLPDVPFVGIIDDFTQPLDGQGKPIGDVYSLENRGAHHIYQHRATIEEAAQRRETVALRFDEVAHLYDVLQGEYLGHRDRIEQTISPGSLRLVAALPYKVDHIKLTLPERVRKGAELSLRANVVTASGETGVGTHILRIELLNPQGEVVEHYARNVRAEGGACTETIHLALDETPGAWRATVADVMTGVSAEQIFEVY